MKAAREEAGCAALPGEEVGCAALPEALPEVLVLSFVLMSPGCASLADFAYLVLVSHFFTTPKKLKKTCLGEIGGVRN